MRGRPWDPIGRGEPFFMYAAYVVVDAVTMNESGEPIVRLLVHQWPRFCGAGHLHFPGERVTVFVEISALAAFLGRYCPSLRIREGAVFYAAHVAFAPREGELLVSPAAHFMRPLADVSDAARNMAAKAMLRAIHRDDAASSCDWNE